MDLYLVPVLASAYQDLLACSTYLGNTFLVEDILTSTQQWQVQCGFVLVSFTVLLRAKHISSAYSRNLGNTLVVEEMLLGTERSWYLAWDWGWGIVVQRGGNQSIWWVRVLMGEIGARGRSKF